MVKALVLDFDGLILATEQADSRAWMHQFALAGAPITLETYSEYWEHWSFYRQRRMIHRLATLADREVDAEAILAARKRHYDELCADLPVMPGIMAWLERARELGIACVVASNDETGRAIGHLSRLGLDGYFQQVITLQSGQARKPAPDLYLQALTALGTDPAATVGIEDSSHGVTAAHRAGLRTVLVRHEVSRLLETGPAELVLDSATDATLDEVLELLAASATPRSGW